MKKFRVRRHEIIQPQDDSIRLIPLTRGLNATVDAADYEWLMQWTWGAVLKKKTWYARRADYESGKQKIVYMHRQIIGGESDQIDHRDGDGLNNRRMNLRPATYVQNSANQRGRPSRSGYKGVFKKRSKWGAKVCINRTIYYLGLYDSPEEAYAAWCKFVTEKNGEFARLS